MEMKQDQMGVSEGERVRKRTDTAGGGEGADRESRWTVWLAVLGQWCMCAIMRYAEGVVA